MLILACQNDNEFRDKVFSDADYVNAGLRPPSRPSRPSSPSNSSRPRSDLKSSVPSEDPDEVSSLLPGQLICMNAYFCLSGFGGRVQITM